MRRQPPTPIPSGKGQDGELRTIASTTGPSQPFHLAPDLAYVGEAFNMVMVKLAPSTTGRQGVKALSNMTLERTAGSRALAAAAHRHR